MKRHTFSLSIFLVAAVASTSFVMAAVNKYRAYEPKFGNDEQEFVFVGNCPNGSKYRLYSYQLLIDGANQSFYDFAGPAGQGSVRTNAQPKKMVTRVCHELADINSGSKFD